eukprot:SAG31_NODE_5460_length_2524_cov_1.650309_1_plen_170_part_00
MPLLRTQHGPGLQGKIQPISPALWVFQRLAEERQTLADKVWALETNHQRIIAEATAQRERVSHLNAQLEEARAAHKACETVRTRLVAEKAGDRLEIRQLKQQNRRLANELRSTRARHEQQAIETDELHGRWEQVELKIKHLERLFVSGIKCFVLTCRTSRRIVTHRSVR